MAKTDNLTDFLTDVADSIRAKKGTSGLIDPQDFSDEIASIQTDPTLQNKSITITQNGTQTVSADSGYDGLGQVEITTNVDIGYEVESIDNGDGTQTLQVIDGGSQPTTLAEFYAQVDQLCEDTILDSYNNPVPTSIIYTTQPVTLYTPNANCTHYFIFKNSSGKFGIVWFNYSVGYLLLYPSGSRVVPAYLAFTVVRTHLTVTFSSLIFRTQYTSQDRYDTIDQAIAAIQSDQTTYVTNSATEWQNSSQGLNTYGNTKYSMLETIDSNTPLPLTFYELAKISENETIEVIQ